MSRRNTDYTIFTYLSVTMSYEANNHNILDTYTTYFNDKCWWNSIKYYTRCGLRYQEFNDRLRASTIQEKNAQGTYITIAIAAGT